MRQFIQAKQQGFTLIELVVVIIVFGILAAVAVPKFVNLKSEARISSLHAIEGALASASTLIEMKAKIDNIIDGSIEINGESVLVNDGYITGHWNNAWRYALDIGKTIGYTQASQVCSVNDICGLGNQRTAPGLPITTSGRGLVLLWLNGMKLSDLCYSYYYNPSDGDAPSTGIVSSGC